MQETAGSVGSIGPLPVSVKHKENPAGSVVSSGTPAGSETNKQTPAGSGKDETMTSAGSGYDKEEPPADSCEEADLTIAPAE